MQQLEKPRFSLYLSLTLVADHRDGRKYLKIDINWKTLKFLV